MTELRDIHQGEWQAWSRWNQSNTETMSAVGSKADKDSYPGFLDANDSFKPQMPRHGATGSDAYPAGFVRTRVCTFRLDATD